MNFQRLLPLIARTLLTVIFIRSGIGKILDFSGTQQTMSDVGIPLTPLVLVFTILFEIVGALLVITGFKARLGAILLLIFIIPATIVFHNPLADPSQTTQLFKNLSIMGGLLLILAYGPGPFSLEDQTESSKDHGLNKTEF
jgi:putative oxidoreductase